MSRPETNLCLAQARDSQRRQNTKFPGGLSAGSQLEDVIRIFSVCQCSEPAFSRDLLHSREKLKFTEITAIDWIAGVPRIIELSRSNYFHVGSEAFGGGHCARQRSAR